VGRNKNNPFVAALIGILLIPGSVCLQAWNEYRTVHRTRGLKEAGKVVENITNPSVLEEQLDGKLVHLSGAALTEEVLKDGKFGIAGNGIALRRRVQMYQWKEEKDTENDRTTYRYQRVWKGGRIDSDRFENRGHDNPKPAFDSWHKVADHVMIGEYEISPALKQQKDDSQSLKFNLGAVKETIGDPFASKLSDAGRYLYYADGGGTSSSPEIGDLQIEFVLVPNGPVSLMAGLSGNTFASFSTSNGEPIERLFPGTLTAGQIIDKLKSENQMLSWILRGVGFALCLAGVTMIFAPAQALFRWIPLVGDITGGLIFVVGLLVAGTLSLVTISISWIVVRPVLGIALLLVAGGLVYLLARTRRRVQNSRTHDNASDGIAE